MTFVEKAPGCAARARFASYTFGNRSPEWNGQPISCVPGLFFSQASAPGDSLPDWT
jgi:hypothetical protein